MQCFCAGAVPERAGEAEEGVGESSARGGGGGEETQRRGTITHKLTETRNQKHRCFSDVL